MPNLTPNPMRSTSKNPFAHHTMSVRLPDLAQKIATQDTLSSYSKNALNTLAESMRHNETLFSQDYLAPDAFYWQGVTDDTTTWQATSWFVAEMAFFREIINRVDYWQTGVDPYFAIKQDELNSEGFKTQLERATSVAGDDATVLKQMLHLALWGNRADLSLPEVLELGQTVADDDLLIDDSEQIVEHLLARTGAVHLITDNFGTELAMDMMLIYHLVRMNIPVVMHVKMNPTYVSDATAQDVHWLLDAFPERVAASKPMVDVLNDAINSRLLHIHPDFFWHAPHFYDQIPRHLFTAFQQARVIISKGDANYRRAVFDTVWDVETDFSILVETIPAPFVALRTLKSDPIVGISQTRAHQLDATGVNWRTRGQYGVIQAAL